MIERDGFTTSLWQATAKPFTTRNTLTDTNAVFDVIIIGGGITGITTALQLQEAGKHCLVVEAQNLCYGTTGGTTAHLNTLLDTPYTTIAKNFGKDNARHVATAAAQALALIRRNIQAYAIDCGYTEADAYLYAQNSKEEKELQDVFEASKDAGLDVQLQNDLPFPAECVKAMKAGGQAKFNPLDYVYGVATVFESLGGTILQLTKVTNASGKDPITVETSAGNFSATNVLYATHIPTGVNLLHLRCSPYRTYAMAVLLEDDNYPTDLVYDMLDPYHYYRTQRVNGVDYLIAGGKDHKTGHEKNTDFLFTTLEATVRSHYKVKEVVHQWSSQYFEPADGLPYIGHLPGHANNFYVATGFGGNGMTYSHVSASVLTDLITGRENKLIDIFKPGRVKPVAGFTSFIANTAEAVSNYAGKLFSGEKIGTLAALAAGEGKIVDYEGEKIALYKDEQGNLHAIAPKCTHMGCEVQWNAAERSWDCSCHGGRFDCNGQVLTGPPDRPLEKLSLEGMIAK